MQALLRFPTGPIDCFVFCFRSCDSLLSSSILNGFAYQKFHAVEEPQCEHYRASCCRGACCTGSCNFACTVLQLCISMKGFHTLPGTRWVESYEAQLGTKGVYSSSNFVAHRIELLHRSFFPFLPHPHHTLTNIHTMPFQHTLTNIHATLSHHTLTNMHAAPFQHIKESGKRVYEATPNNRKPAREKAQSQERACLRLNDITALLHHGRPQERRRRRSTNSYCRMWLFLAAARTFCSGWVICEGGRVFRPAR
jgi:hypothetical protein